MGNKSKNLRPKIRTRVKSRKQKQEPKHIIKHDKWTEAKGNADLNTHAHKGS